MKKAETRQTDELLEQLDVACGLRETGKYAEALAKFESLEQESVHPQDIAALRLFQATCLTDMGRPDDALLRLLQVDRNNLVFSAQIDLEYERARIERSLGHAGDALQIAGRALQIADVAIDKDELSVVAGGLRTLRAILLAETDQCDAAIPLLEAVPSDDAGWAEANLKLGDCYYTSRRYREAIHCYLGLISSENEIGTVFRNDAIRNTGCAYYRLGDYAKAVEYLLQAKDGYDSHPELKAELLAFLASAYSHLGMPQEAAKYANFSKVQEGIQ